MSEPQRCEFFFLRYVPNPINGEFVNFGVVMLDADRRDGAEGFTAVRFAHDLRRVKCVDANADLEWLHAFEEDLRHQLSVASTREEMLAKINQFSNLIQTSSNEFCQTTSPREEVERIAREYLEPPKQKPERIGLLRGRMAVYQPMRALFIKAGVWELMQHRISVAVFTHPGDRFKIDCGYRSNDIFKMFHALSLKSESDDPKVLAYSYPKSADGIGRREKAEARLTAVVEDDLDRKSDSVQFALDTFDQAHIAVATLSQVVQLAEVARKELRV